MRRRFRRRRAKRPAKSVVRFVRRELHKAIENKFVDGRVDTFNLFSDSGGAGAGYFNLLNGLTQGTAVGNRVGNKTRLRMRLSQEA